MTGRPRLLAGRPEKAGRLLREHRSLCDVLCAVRLDGASLCASASKPFRPRTSRYPHARGAPVHIGDPEVIGITDLSRPGYDEPVPIHPERDTGLLGLRRDTSGSRGQSPRGFHDPRNPRRCSGHQQLLGRQNRVREGWPIDLVGSARVVIEADRLGDSPGQAL
jgi:Protein of unknown function (DUF1445)